MYERLLSVRLGEQRRTMLLLGPRQVGKSTLLHGLAPGLTIDLARFDVGQSKGPDPTA